MKNIFLLTAAALLLASCGKKEAEWLTPSGEALPVSLAGGGEASGGGEPSGPVPVEAAPVKVQDLETGLDTSGNILPWESALLSARLPGRIKKVSAEEGARVAAGVLVAELETEDVSIELSRARSAAAQARSRYERVKKLYDEAAATVTQLEGAESADKEASSALSALKEKMEAGRVTAPFAGIISRKLAAQGTVVSAGQPVAELVDLSRVKIEAGFSEVEAKYVEKGRKAQVTVDAYPDRKFEGEVNFVGAVVDPVTRTFPVRVAISNKDGLLKAGMSARVRIVTGSFPGALTVPSSALAREGEKTFVFVLTQAGQGGEYAASRREVAAGLHGGGAVHVKSGLQKGELVAARGLEKLSDGASARIVNADH
jgi:RND family efflux transporter MFP subunit